MLQPKRTKYRKVQKGKMKGNSQRGHELSNGMFGIKSVHEDGMFLTSRQIEAARIAATRYMKREGQLWIKIFPDKPITKKPLEVRMGKGKGAVEYWAAVVKPGRIMFEVGGVPLSVAKEALRLAAQKLPVKTKFVIARVQGKAVGGGVGIASAADYTLASTHASVKLSELAVGIGPFVVGPAVERKIGTAAFSALAIDATNWRNTDWAKRKGLFAEIHDSVENMDEAEILPGVVNILEFIKEKKQLIALGSASKNARPILEKVKILHMFDVIVDGNDVTNAKPDPEVFLRAAKLLNVTNENSMVFEDSVAGIQAANIANMTSIGIGDEKILHEAKYNFKDFTFMDTSFIEAFID